MSKEVFESIKAGLEEALLYAQGKISLPTREYPDEMPRLENPIKLSKEKPTKTKKRKRK